MTLCSCAALAAGASARPLIHSQPPAAAPTATASAPPGDQQARAPRRRLQLRSRRRRPWGRGARCRAARPPSRRPTSPARIEGGRALGVVQGRLLHRLAGVLEDRRLGRGRRRERLGGERLARLGEGAPHLTGVGEAAGGVARERALDDGRDRRRGVGRPAPERHGVALRDRLEDLRHRATLERPQVGEDLVEQGAEREHVGACIRLLAPHLLGGHVVRSPHQLAGLRHLRRGQAGETEVEDLHLPGRLDVNVSGLEVAVHDATRVREGEAVADLLDEVDPLEERARASAGGSPRAGRRPRAAPSPCR